MHTLTLLRHHPLSGAAHDKHYCFDDPERKISAEPLMDQASSFLINASEAVWGETQNQLVATFTADRDESSAMRIGEGRLVLMLDLIGPAEDGWTYDVTILSPPALSQAQDWAVIIGEQAEDDNHVWLCPVLLDYFGSPPQRFWVQLRCSQSSASC